VLPGAAHPPASITTRPSTARLKHRGGAQAHLPDKWKPHTTRTSKTRPDRRHQRTEQRSPRASAQHAPNDLEQGGCGLTGLHPLHALAKPPDKRSQGAFNARRTWLFRPPAALCSTSPQDPSALTAQRSMASRPKERTGGSGGRSPAGRGLGVAPPKIWRDDEAHALRGHTSPIVTRRMRDLNPRGLSHPTRFPIVRTRPLCESSVGEGTGGWLTSPKRLVVGLAGGSMRSSWPVRSTGLVLLGV
jgi:hypothetical protein